MVRLNVGSGPHRRPGYVSVDAYEPSADVFNAVQELNVLLQQAVDEGLEVKISVVPIRDCEAKSYHIACNVKQPITDADIP